MLQDLASSKRHIKFSFVAHQIAVDGREAKENNIVQQVRGSDIVGSKVVLTVRKGDCPSDCPD